MIRQSAHNPLVFIFDVMEEGEFRDRLVNWFVLKQPRNIVRTLVNKERDQYGGSFELIFDDPVDAMEFKLVFL